jgi:hypothetical protein
VNEVQKLLCWLLGHNRMTTSTRQRICLRCGTRETLRHYGQIIGWEVVTKAAVRGSRA